MTMRATKSVKVTEELLDLLKSKAGCLSITEEADRVIRLGLEQLELQERKSQSMLAKLNDKPVAGAQCWNCKNELHSVRMEPGESKGHVATDRQVGYYCTNENCPKFGVVTLNYFHSSAARVETVSEIKEPVVAEP